MLNFFKKNVLITVFIIFLVIGLGLYANSFGNQFFWDDDDLIVKNSYVQNFQVGNFFTENEIAGNGQISNYWRPLVLISFAVDYKIWGLAPIGFHLTNTFLHIFCAWLVFIFLLKLIEAARAENNTPRPSTGTPEVSGLKNPLDRGDLLLAFLPALFFLIHPLQTEAVTYVSGRADSLSAIFCLLSLIFYFNFRTGENTSNLLINSAEESISCSAENLPRPVDNPPRLSTDTPEVSGLKNPPKRGIVHPSPGGELLYSLLFFVFGLLVKEQVILLPALILLVEIFFVYKNNTPRPSTGTPLNRGDLIAGLLVNFKKFIWLLSFAAISLVYFILRITILNFNDILGGTANLEGAYAASGILERIYTFFFVILNYFSLLFAPFNLHMSREIVPVASFFSWPVISFLILLSLIIFICIKTWKSEKLISFGFLWFFIILLPRTNIIKINRPMYEHWLYLPMVGFWLAIFALIFLLWKIYLRCKNNTPRPSATPLFRGDLIWIKIIFYFLVISFIIFLSILTIARNRVWRDPITFYENNLRYTPNSFIQHNNLGMAYANIGQLNKAIVEYKKAIAIADIYPQVHHNLANSLADIGLIDEAIVEYRRSIAKSPGSFLSYPSLVNLYLEKGDKDELDNILAEMEGVFAEQAVFWYLKGMVYSQRGEDSKAKEFWQKGALLEHKTY